MERLTRWLQKRAQQAETRVTLEEALLGGRFFRYARYRLVGFGVNRVLGAVTHVLEFVFLAGLFQQKGILASLAFQNTSLLAEAFWWGCLEVMRRRIRVLSQKVEVSTTISNWLAAAVVLGLLAMTVAAGISVGTCVYGGREPSVLDAYALVCALRLAIDLVARTYYSGVYALERVHRPLYTIFLTDPVGLLLVLALWPYFGIWCFPVGLAATVVLSRGLAFHYTKRKYALLRLPALRIRFGRALRALRALGARADPEASLGLVFRAGVANLSSRVGSLLVLGALLWPLLHGGDPGELVLALHISATLLGAAGFWTQLFYHDFKRLEDDTYTLLRRRLERSLLGTALLVGFGLWAAAAIAVAALLQVWEVASLLAGLLPVFLTLSCLATLQLREFTRGRFWRLFVSSALLCAAVWCVILWGSNDNVTTWSSLMTAALMSGAAVLWVFGLTRQETETSGVLPSLLRWVQALASIKGPVRIARATTADATVTHCRLIADRLARALGPRGAVVVAAASRRVLWFEQRPAVLDLGRLVSAGVGKLKSLDLTAYAEDGPSALTAGEAKGFFSETPTSNVESSAEGLLAAFRAQFADRAIVADLGDRKGNQALAKLDPIERRTIWMDAAREARQGSPARHRSEFDVSTFRPGGEIRLLFLVPRTEPGDARSAWRKLLNAANWEASTRVRSG